MRIHDSIQWSTTFLKFGRENDVLIHTRGVVEESCLFLFFAKVCHCNS